MRVLMISKACVVGAYQRKLELLAAQPNIDLSVLVPPVWADPSGPQPLERVYTQGYQLLEGPLRYNGNYHLHYTRGLGQLMMRHFPQIVHIDEEPYNLATWQALFWAKRIGARALFFSWQNIYRRYPPPFSIGEQWVLRLIDHALVGTEAAGQVWRAKGYAGPMTVLPQFGIDPGVFRFRPRPVADPPVIGYVGRLVPEKGVDVLIRAAARLHGCEVRIIGQGPEKAALMALAAQLRISSRVFFMGQRRSTEMPDIYPQFDVLALPSRSTPRWKEQFGRVLIESMACGTPVVGAQSGAIPEVLGEGGMLFPEGDPNGLADSIGMLIHNQRLRQQMIERGHERVLARYTQQHIAEQTAAVYRRLHQHPEVGGPFTEAEGV